MIHNFNPNPNPTPKPNPIPNPNPKPNPIRKYLESEQQQQFGPQQQLEQQLLEPQGLTVRGRMSSRKPIPESETVTFGVRRKASTIHGNGLFATKAFLKGEMVLITEGTIFRTDRDTEEMQNAMQAMPGKDDNSVMFKQADANGDYKDVAFVSHRKENIKKPRDDDWYFMNWNTSERINVHGKVDVTVSEGQD